MIVRLRCYTVRLLGLGARERRQEAMTSFGLLSLSVS
jgi:hypothetical protein